MTIGRPIAPLATPVAAPLLVVAMFLAILIPLDALAADPGQERRIALVVGISAYQNAPRLPNPVNDARAIADALHRLNFDVAELYDPGFIELNHGIRAFGIKAAAADVAVVYYAGHGVQVDRENFLIPADAKLERERDLLYEAMPLERLLGEVSQASHIGIVLLDSCRNNPFVERISRSLVVAGRAVSTTPGMALVDKVPRNTMVVMAAKADQVAEDGNKHSPFAAALLAHLQIPGIELSLFFRSVRDSVLRATYNRQEPYVFSSLGAEPFYFYPRPPNHPPEIGAIKPLDLTENAGPTPLGMPQPTDPDQDPLTIRITGMPRFGELLVDGKVQRLNAIISADQFKSATYKPDGKTIGSAGSLDILIEDGRGGSVTASLPITVKSSHRPPILGGPEKVQFAQYLLNISTPMSPDGDPLIITVTALPRGTVRSGGVIVHVGDRLSPMQLSSLAFWPEAGFTGYAGSLRYTVDNGHGGVAEGATDVEITAASNPTSPSVEASFWANLQTNKDPTAFNVFLAMYPSSVHADEARRRLAQLTGNSGAPNPPDKPPEKPPTAAPAAPPAEAKAPATVVTASNVPFVPPPTPPSVRGVEKTFQDCPTCPRMVRIPAGGFMMGQGAIDTEAMPAHRVDVRGFAIGQYPVTVAEWRACVAAKGCNFTPRMRISEDRTPVHNVSWEDVGQYMTWLSTTSGRSYRLPSEAEWEYAARGGTSTRYWWGDTAGKALANCADCGGQQDIYGPAPVDALPPNPFGLYDILGGVAQWTADCWFPNYKGAPSDATPREAKLCEKRVLRGGSFRAQHDQITVTYRLNYDAPVRYLVNGFRVARDVQP